MKICLSSGKSKDLLRVTASVQSWPFLALHSTFQIKLLCASWYPGVQLGGRGEVSPALFWKSKKSALIFGKKGPVIVHLCVEYSIQNVVLRVSRRKNSKNFPCRAHFFLVFLAEFLSKYPNSVKCPLPWKISGNAPVIFGQLVLHWRHAYALNVQWQRFMPMRIHRKSNLQIICTYRWGTYLGHVNDVLGKTI